jgi:hypothetical protein
MDDTPYRAIQVYELTFPDGSKVWYWCEVDANNPVELPESRSGDFINDCIACVT